MSNQGQGLLSHFYPGNVCCVLILGPDISRAFTGPLVLWLHFAYNFQCSSSNVSSQNVLGFTHIK